MMTDISRAVLSSLFYASELSGEMNHELHDIDIQPEDFQMHFHKIMAHLFNHLKSTKQPITFDMAIVHLTQQSVLDQNEILNIMSATPFGAKNMVQKYLDSMRLENKKSLIGRI